MMGHLFSRNPRRKGKKERTEAPFKSRAWRYSKVGMTLALHAAHLDLTLNFARSKPQTTTRYGTQGMGHQARDTTT